MAKKTIKSRVKKELKSMKNALTDPFSTKFKREQKDAQKKRAAAIKKRRLAREKKESK